MPHKTILDQRTDSSQTCTLRMDSSNRNMGSSSHNMGSNLTGSNIVKRQAQDTVYSLCTPYRQSTTADKILQAKILMSRCNH